MTKNYTGTYVVVGQELGLGLKGVMDEAEAAAMWREARFLDNQSKTVLKHLMAKFNTRITVPFDKMYTLVKG